MHVYVYQYTHMLAKPVFSFSGRLSCGIQTVCHFKIVFLTWGWSCPVRVHQTMSRCLQVVQDRKICPKVLKSIFTDSNVICFASAFFLTSGLQISTKHNYLPLHKVSWCFTALFPGLGFLAHWARRNQQNPCISPSGLPMCSVGRGTNDGLVPIFKDSTPICACIKAAKKVSNWGKI